MVLIASDSFVRRAIVQREPEIPSLAGGEDSSAHHIGPRGRACQPQWLQALVHVVEPTEPPHLTQVFGADFFTGPA